jgi:hypothetical protein
MIRRLFTYTLFWLCGNADDNLYGFDELDEEGELDEPIPYVLTEEAA